MIAIVCMSDICYTVPMLEYFSEGGLGWKSPDVARFELVPKCIRVSQARLELSEPSSNLKLKALFQKKEKSYPVSPSGLNKSNDTTQAYERTETVSLQISTSNSEGLLLSLQRSRSCRTSLTRPVQILQRYQRSCDPS